MQRRQQQRQRVAELQRLARMKKQDKGASAVEYGLMIAAIAGVLAAVLFSLGTVVRDTFAKHTSCFSSQLDSRSC